MAKLSHLKPTDVFKYFEDICSIPHGSGNMEQIRGYCVEFAKAHGFDYYTDELCNVIIRKPASKGYESHPIVILQGHLDMVCEKLPDCDFDFEKDSLRLAIDGDFIYAEGTTLGGDDGIAVAMILAVLDDNSIAHPAIEAVFTTDEEIGMFGAEGLDANEIKGKQLINIDSEQMGVITAGCAGGARVDISVPLTVTENRKLCFEITLGGLIGGHSGIDVNKGRLNANKLMGKLLADIEIPFNIVSVAGGAKDNVITRECKCVIAADEIPNNLEEFVLNNKNKSEPHLFIDIKSAEKSIIAFDDKSTEKIIALINELPYGIVKMSEDIEGLVQTSLNLGVLRSEKSSVFTSFGLRSSVGTEKVDMIDGLREICNRFEGEFSEYGNYPAWEYHKESALRDTMVSVYDDMFGSKPEIEIIHAGLECGLFASKISNFDAVSIGPDLYDIHTARERLSISSTGLLYDYLLKVLERL